MFNVTSIYDGPSTVVEQRAPTDESVRLLKEMEEAARKKVEETIVVANTAFECKIQKIIDHMSAQDIYKIFYSMNGIKQRLDIRVDHHKMLSIPELACHIRDQLAVDIATVMISTAFRGF